MRRRLSREQRKVEIQNHALKLFTDKGYRSTTMQDLARSTGLSAGGLYHHYRSTSEVLYDLMLRGNVLRQDQILREAGALRKPANDEWLAKIFVDKILADNELIPVYVMFLEALRDDEALRGLFERIREASVESMRSLLARLGYPGFPRESWELLTGLVNAMILGGGVLGLRELFAANRGKLEAMILALLRASKGANNE